MPNNTSKAQLNSVTGQPTHFQLVGQLDFTSVPAVLPAFQAVCAEQLTAGGSVIIDLSGVSSSNSAGLAMLVEWLAIARQHQTQLAFEHVPENMQAAARASDLQDLLFQPNSPS